MPTELPTRFAAGASLVLLAMMLGACNLTAAPHRTDAAAQAGAQSVDARTPDLAFDQTVDTTNATFPEVAPGGTGGMGGSGGTGFGPDALLDVPPVVIDAQPSDTPPAGDLSQVFEGNFALQVHSSGKCLTVPADPAHNGYAETDTCVAGSTTQMFHLVLFDAHYRIGSVDGTKCLGTEGAQLLDSARIQLTTCAGGIQQTFTIGDSSTAYHPFVNNTSGKCLDVKANAVTDGAVVQQYGCNGTAAQQWLPIRVFEKVGYTIVSKLTGYCLDVFNSSVADGAKVQQWTCNGTSTQSFQINTQGNQLALVNVNSGKCVDLSSTAVPGKLTSQQLTCNQGVSQTFRAQGVGGGYDHLVNNADGSCLQIPDSTAGQPIEEAPCNASDNQSWKISRI